MNWQASLDGLLMLVALWAALGPTRAMPAAQLGCLLFAVAAMLGTLRFSGLLSLPQLHQFMSALGASVAMPLLATAVMWPQRAVAREPKFVWILGVALAVMYVLVGVVAATKSWSAACAVLSAFAIIGISVARRQWLALAAGFCMLAAFVLFASQVSWADLRPGEFLHVGLALGLLLFALWMPARASAPAAQPSH
ncbi:MAG: hypothetical protein EXR27_14210 [Betaproteobacteria bacterium]|nr:hypothetical protein [Betaproteobacteria bacterium]